MILCWQNLLLLSQKLFFLSLSLLATEGGCDVVEIRENGLMEERHSKFTEKRHSRVKLRRQADGSTCLESFSLK